MERIKKFKSFKSGVKKVKKGVNDYIRQLLSRGGKFASDVWEAAKVEGEETKVSLEIISRMMKGEKITAGEKKFLKEHSKDIIKILPLILVQGIPIPIPLATLLVVFGRKYGFDFLPKDHRALLKEEDREEEV